MFRNFRQKKHIRKSLVRQKDQTDCGVACLATVIQYYRGLASLERLRELSGTDQQGTTMLGLYQAAEQVGLTAQ
ncbi:MAG: cysteine peptidase family C39 domain-containing protein, partial [Calditrichota bacterium]